jgi:hypothetical protein
MTAMVSQSKDPVFDLMRAQIRSGNIAPNTLAVFCSEVLSQERERDLAAVVEQAIPSMINTCEYDIPHLQSSQDSLVKCALRLCESGRTDEMTYAMQVAVKIGRVIEDINNTPKEEWCPGPRGAGFFGCG